MARAQFITMEDNMPLVMSWVKSSKNMKMFVGVTDENDARSDSHIGNVALANILENGAPSANVPARPFMSPAMRGMKDQIRDSLKRAAAFALNGHKDRARVELENLGKEAVGAIRSKMESGVPPGHAKSTIKKNKGDHTTLMDTKQLWNAISYKIVGV
jgi:hypothetical protein